MTIATRALDGYAWLMCRAIWAARRVFPAGPGDPLVPNFAYRDWEWHGRHVCENCGHGCKHKFISWIEDGHEVVTAECSHCSFEATL